MIYLDNAATTLIKPPSVMQAMVSAISTCGNAGRGGHVASMTASDVVYSCRELAGDLFGQPKIEEIVFAHNTTHALNIAIFGTMFLGGHCLVSGYEHNSVIRPLRMLADRCVTYTVVKSRLFEPDDFIEQFKNRIKPDTKCAVCTHISNVFGYILPIVEIDRICAEYGISLIIDAAQSAGCIPVKLCDLKATVAICVPGHKGLYGPQGTGLLICRDGAALRPLIYGGTGSVSKSTEQPNFMPDRHESGTLNIHGIAGLKAGIEYVLNRGENAVFNHEKQLIRYATEILGNINGIRVFSGDAQAGVLSFVSERFSAETVAEYLGENQVAVRGGLHCSALAHDTVGTSNGTVRISVSDFNTEKEIETLATRLKRL